MNEGEASSDGAAAREPSRPRWTPTRYPLHPDDICEDESVEARPSSGVPALLLGRATVQQHDVANQIVRRGLHHERGVTLTPRMHPSGVVFLEHEAEGSRRIRGFVVASASSMEPRPIWPMLFPTAILQIARIDWVASCSVPKPPALADIESTTPDAYVLGWLPAPKILELPLVVLEPHLGHEFKAEYRQAKNHQLWSLERFPRA